MGNKSTRTLVRPRPTISPNESECPLSNNLIPNQNRFDKATPKAYQFEASIVGQPTSVTFTKSPPIPDQIPDVKKEEIPQGKDVTIPRESDPRFYIYPDDRIAYLRAKSLKRAAIQNHSKGKGQGWREVSRRISPIIIHTVNNYDFLQPKPSARDNNSSKPVDKSSKQSKLDEWSKVTTIGLIPWPNVTTTKDDDRESVGNNNQPILHVTSKLSNDILTRWIKSGRMTPLSKTKLDSQCSKTPRSHTPTSRKRTVSKRSLSSESLQNITLSSPSTKPKVRLKSPSTKRPRGRSATKKPRKKVSVTQVPESSKYLERKTSEDFDNGSKTERSSCSKPEPGSNLRKEEEKPPLKTNDTKQDLHPGQSGFTKIVETSQPSAVAGPSRLASNLKITTLISPKKILTESVSIDKSTPAGMASGTSTTEPSAVPIPTGTIISDTITRSTCPSSPALVLKKKSGAKRRKRTERARAQRRRCIELARPMGFQQRMEKNLQKLALATTSKSKDSTSRSRKRKKSMPQSRSATTPVSRGQSPSTVSDSEAAALPPITTSMIETVGTSREMSSTRNDHSISATSYKERSKAKKKSRKRIIY